MKYSNDNLKMVTDMKQALENTLIFINGNKDKKDNKAGTTLIVEYLERGDNYIKMNKLSEADKSYLYARNYIGQNSNNTDKVRAAVAKSVDVTNKKYNEIKNNICPAYEYKKEYK